MPYMASQFHNVEPTRLFSAPPSMTFCITKKVSVSIQAERFLHDIPLLLPSLCLAALRSLRAKCGTGRIQLPERDKIPWRDAGNIFNTATEKTNSPYNNGSQSPPRRKRASFTSQEDTLIAHLKEELQLPWKEVHQRHGRQFPPCSRVCLQVRYSTKLKIRVANRPRLQTTNANLKGLTN